MPELLLPNKPAPKYNVSGIFYTLQGEGPHVGTPAIFVRFSGCNLRCEWGKNRCDTPYTSWAPEANMRAIQDLITDIDKMADEHKCNYIVITGGEPTIQQLDPLCDILRQKQFELSIETNGTNKIPEQIDFVICSPKLKDSVPEKEPERTLHERSRTRIMENLLRYPKPGRLFLKFVVTPKTDMNEIIFIVSTLRLPPFNVYLMPEGITKEDILEHQTEVAELAKKFGFNFTTRLHVLLWGNARNT